MKLFILNEQLQRTKPITVYESLTWNTFYREEGNFTLVVPMDLFPYLSPSESEDIFLENTDDVNVGLIETIEKTVDDNNQKSLTVKGRLCVCLLDRRVTLDGKNYENKTAAEVVDDFVFTNVTSPKNNLRTISLIEYNLSQQPTLEDIDYELERGLDGLELLKALSKISNFGFYMGFNTTYDKLQLNLYIGTDRSLNQNIVRPFVIQQKRNTVVQIDYFKDVSSHKTWAEVDKENEVRTTYVAENDKTLSGLRRKETYFDLSSMSQTITQADGTQIVIRDDYYENMIQNESKSRMESLVKNEYLDSQLNSQIASKFKNEIYLGDRITIKDDEIGFIQDIDITGATEVWSGDGYEVSLQIGQNTLEEV